MFEHGIVDLYFGRPVEVSGGFVQQNEAAPSRREHSARHANKATSTQLNARVAKSTVHHFISFTTMARFNGVNTASSRRSSSATTPRPCRSAVRTIGPTSRTTLFR
jgi:hypothetical protein